MTVFETGQVRRLLRTAALASLAGRAYGRSPSVDIIGSFFPVWMVCLAAAIVLTFGARYILVRTRMETEVGPLALFYPSIVVLFSCTLWLIFFR